MPFMCLDTQDTSIWELVFTDFLPNQWRISIICCGSPTPGILGEKMPNFSNCAQAAVPGIEGWKNPQISLLIYTRPAGKAA